MILIKLKMTAKAVEKNIRCQKMAAPLTSKRLCRKICISTLKSGKGVGSGDGGDIFVIFNKYALES